MFTLFSSLTEPDRASAIRLFLKSAGATFDQPAKRSHSLKNLAFSLTGGAHSKLHSMIRGSIEGFKEEAGVTKRDIFTLFASGINPILGFLAYSTKAQLTGFDKVAYSVEENTQTLGSKLDLIKAAIEEGPIVKTLKRIGSLGDKLAFGLRLFLKGRELFHSLTYGYRTEVKGSPHPSLMEVLPGGGLSLPKRFALMGAGFVAGRFLPSFFKGAFGAAFLEKSLINIMDREFRQNFSKIAKEEGILTAVGKFLRTNVDMAANQISKNVSFMDKISIHFAKRLFLDDRNVKTMKKKISYLLRISSEEVRMLEFEYAKGIFNKFYKWIGLKYPTLYKILETFRVMGPAAIKMFVKSGIDVFRGSVLYEFYREFKRSFKHLLEKTFGEKFVENLTKRIEAVGKFIGDKFGGTFKLAGKLFGKVGEFLFGKGDPLEEALNNIHDTLTESKGTFQSFYEKIKSIFGAIKEYFTSFIKNKALPVYNKFKKGKEKDEIKEALDKVNENLEKNLEKQSSIEEGINKVNESVKKSSKEEAERDTMSFIANLFGNALSFISSKALALLGGLKGLGILGKLKGVGLKALGGVSLGYLGYKAIAGEEDKEGEKGKGILGDVISGAIGGAAFGPKGALAGAGIGLISGITRNYITPWIEKHTEGMRKLDSEGEYMHEVLSEFEGNVEHMKESLTSFDKQVVEKGSKSFDLFSNLSSIGTGVMTALSEAWDKFKTKGSEIASNIGSSIVSGIGKVSESVREAFFGAAGKFSASQFKGPGENYLKQVLAPESHSKIPLYYGKYYSEVSGITREQAINEALKTMEKFKTDLNLDNDLIAMYLGKFQYESRFNPFSRTSIPGQTASGLAQLTDSSRLKMLVEAAKRFGIDIKDCKGSTEEKIQCITQKILENKHKTGIENLVQLETYLGILHNYRQKITVGKEKISLHEYLQRYATTPQDKWMLLRLFHAHPATATRIYSAYKRGMLDVPVSEILKGDPKAAKHLEAFSINTGKPPEAIKVRDVIRAFGADVSVLGGMGHLAKYLEKHSTQVAMHTSPITQPTSNVDLLEMANINKEITQMSIHKPPPQINIPSETEPQTTLFSKPPFKTETKSVVNNPVNSGNIYLNVFNINNNSLASSKTFSVDNFTLRR